MPNTKQIIKELYKRVDQEQELEKRRNNPPSEKPLEQEHTAMDIALMWTQPGG